MTFRVHQTSAATRATFDFLFVVIRAAVMFDGQFVHVSHRAVYERRVALRTCLLYLREPIDDCPRMCQFVSCSFRCCHYVLCPFVVVVFTLPTVCVAISASPSRHADNAFHRRARDSDNVWLLRYPSL